MTRVVIDRELLERIDETAICDGTDATISDDLFTQLVAALAAPRQPEGDGLTRYTIGAYGGILAFVSAADGCMVLHDDHQRAIAELRLERDILRHQRDLLAGLLRMVRQDGWYHPLEEHEIAQIDAALAEVSE